MFSAVGSEAYSVDGFCRSHSISRAHFYQLLKRGDGPRTFKAGKLTLISKEAAADWRAAMERRQAAKESTPA
jgi:hypothetical protein